MAEAEMSMDEILSSIRQILTNEVDQNHTQAQNDPIEDLFILTPEMRCDTPEDLKERMQRVLDKMAQQELLNKKQTIIRELQPLLKDWLIQMRPDLTETQIQEEMSKILPAS